MKRKLIIKWHDKIHEQDIQIPGAFYVLDVAALYATSLQCTPADPTKLFRLHTLL